MFGEIFNINSCLNIPARILLESMIEQKFVVSIDESTYKKCLREE